LFATVYADPHDLGHQCWHLHDVLHPKHAPRLVAKIGNPIRQLYVRIDQAIGRLVDKAGPNATVFVFGGPGMESGYTANFLLDQILRRLEDPDDTDGLTYVDTVKKVYRKVAPPALRNRLASAVQKGEQKMLASDRRKRKCFAVPHNENSGAIRINMIGREQDGKIERADRRVFTDTLIADLKNIVNSDTGEPLVKDVVRVFDTCSGDKVDDLPDLLVIWHRPDLIRRIKSPKIGEIEAEYPGNRTGDHTPHTLYVVCGPGIEAGAKAEESSVIDVGYTLASLLGVPPQDMDGRAIPELVIDR